MNKIAGEFIAGTVFGFLCAQNMNNLYFNSLKKNLLSPIGQEFQKESIDYSIIGN
jgi:hypothetical protein